MTSDMRPAHDIRVRPSFTPGPNRVEEIARVRRYIQPLNPVRLVWKFDRCGLDDNFSRIPCLNPAPGLLHLILVRLLLDPFKVLFISVLDLRDDDFENHRLALWNE